MILMIGRDRNMITLGSIHLIVMRISVHYLVLTLTSSSLVTSQTTRHEFLRDYAGGDRGYSDFCPPEIRAFSLDSAFQ